LHSMKYVLPELVPDLKYDGLVIRDGGVAMNAYEQLLSVTNPEKISQMRKTLLDYCRLDTLGMVKMLEVLDRV
jgi:hypothetical protein